MPQLARAVGEHAGGRAGGDVLLAFIGAVAFAMAASANVPALVLSPTGNATTTFRSAP